MSERAAAQPGAAHIASPHTPRRRPHHNTLSGRNILDHAALRELGFVVYALGKPLDPFLRKGDY